MDQHRQPRSAAGRSAYPWELSEETRRIGRKGLARTRAILEAKRLGPAQQSLPLDLHAPAPVPARLAA